jgi:hypothetical protein
MSGSLYGTNLGTARHHCGHLGAGTGHRTALQLFIVQLRRCDGVGLWRARAATRLLLLGNRYRLTPRQPWPKQAIWLLRVSLAVGQDFYAQYGSYFAHQEALSFTLVPGRINVPDRDEPLGSR